MSPRNNQPRSDGEPPSREENPFSRLSLSSHQVLVASDRATCPNCDKRRRYFCADCNIALLPDPTALPNVTLPLNIEILQAAAEHPQRSTAQHLPLLAPNHARVWRPFPECAPEFRAHVLEDAPPGTVAVLYPCERAVSAAEAHAKLPNLKTLIVIDSTWTKSVLLTSESVLASLPRVTVPPGAKSQFWRYAPKRSEHSEHFSPDKVEMLMSTVESVHRFCDAYDERRSNGIEHYDDLLWLFAFLHRRVRDVYEGAPEKRRRIMRKSKGLLSHL